MTRLTADQKFFRGVARAFKRVSAEARRVARRYGTPVYVLEKGKVVAKRP